MEALIHHIIPKIFDSIFIENNSMPTKSIFKDDLPTESSSEEEIEE